ncbi:MAG: M3 family metallopeptidase [Legionellales bacterium]|nr:M3 family metallopeptidase [Legionellales bacterium]
MKKQPFFSPCDLSNYKTEFTHLLEENKRKIAALAQQENPTFENLIHPLDELSNELHLKWSTLSHMHNVVDTDEVRNVYNEALPLLSDYQTDMGHNMPLFKAFQQIANHSSFASLSAEKQKVVANGLRDFRLSGIELNEEDKAQFRELEKKLSELSCKFGENVMDATYAWEKEISNITALKGLPEHVINYAAKKASEKEKIGWILTLEMPCYLAVMSYSENRELRQEMYAAFMMRASELGDKTFDNSGIMQKILSIRHQLASLLGYHNYAELSLATKMLDKPEKVLNFLNELLSLARPFAQQEFHTLQQFALEHDHIEKIEAWDVPYYSEKLQKQLFNFTSEELRVYFPEPIVLTGLFNLVSELYNIHIEPMQNMLSWHPDVKCFVIRDNHHHEIGYFYLDLYARQQKHGGAWMDDFCSRYRTLSDELQLPIAFLTCNFTAPENNQPALLTHDDVITLFHEFGHGLHHLLTKMEILDISGISGVEWDAVELPSQFMENFCWEKSVLDQISSHYQTREPLPDTLYTQLIASKNFQTAMQIVRQLEFALFDFHIHLDFEPGAKDDFIQKTLNEVRKKVSVVPITETNRFQHGFSHIFAGGYAAGYYSYKWAEVLSSDVYALFQENEVISSEVGHHFLNSILSRGGSDTAMNLFKTFRGREPQVEALLKAGGLLES